MQFGIRKHRLPFGACPGRGRLAVPVVSSLADEKGKHVRTRVCVHPGLGSVSLRARGWALSFKDTRKYLM